MWHDRVIWFLANYNLEPDVDWQQTTALKTAIAAYRTDHPQDGLTRLLFDQIVQWKLRDQIHRIAHRLAILNDSMISEVTGAAFHLHHENATVLSRIRTEILQCIPGVGLGVASAILTMYYPEDFGIIDFRCWDEIHDREPGFSPLARTFTMNQYLKYLATIRPFAREYNRQVQVIDFALWKMWELRRKNKSFIR